MDRRIGYPKTDFCRQMESAKSRGVADLPCYPFQKIVQGLVGVALQSGLLSDSASDLVGRPVSYRQIQIDSAVQVGFDQYQFLRCDLREMGIGRRSFGDHIPFRLD